VRQSCKVLTASTVADSGVASRGPTADETMMWQAKGAVSCHEKCSCTMTELRRGECRQPLNKPIPAGRRKGGPGCFLVFSYSATQLTSVCLSSYRGHPSLSDSYENVFCTFVYMWEWQRPPLNKPHDDNDNNDCSKPGLSGF